MEIASSEQWRPVEGYEAAYEVSDHGRVRSLPRKVRNYGFTERILKPGTHYRGYMVVWLWRGAIRKKFFVHRLVAIAFIPNPRNVPIVNHKNGVRDHNHVSNLEWMNDSENVRHGYERRAREGDMDF